MLQLRNTPDSDCKVSPAQILFGRPLRDAFSFVNHAIDNTAINPVWRKACQAKEIALRTRFIKSVETLDPHARHLPKLACGDLVFVQNQTGAHPNKWDRSGIVIEPKDYDQYLVKLDGTGRLTLRNHRFLRQYTLPNFTYQQTSGTTILADRPVVSTAVEMFKNSTSTPPPKHSLTVECSQKPQRPVVKIPNANDISSP